MFWIFFFSAFASPTWAQVPIVIRVGDGHYTFEVNGPFTKLQRKILKSDLSKLQRLPILNTPLYEAHFGTNQTSFLDWFSQRIHTFAYYKPTDYMSRGKVAGTVSSGYADQDRDENGQHFDKGEFLLAKAYFLEKTASGRLSILIHEARHGDGTKHVACLRKLNHALKRYINNIIACDVDEFGSYAADALIKVQAAHDFHEGDMRDALEEAADSIHRIQSKMSRRVVALAVEELAPTLDYSNIDKRFDL